MDPQQNPAFAAGMTPGSPSCLDPERLAAWADRTLPAGEIATIDAHLADCSRCQQVVAMFALTDEVPGRDAAAVVPMPLWRRLRLQWVAPLAAAAALFWIIIPRDGGIGTANRVDRVARMEAAESSAIPPPAPQPAAPAPGEQSRPRAAAPAPPRASGTAAVPSNSEPPARPRAIGRPESIDNAADRGSRERVDTSVRSESAPAPAAAPPPLSPPAGATPAAAAPVATTRAAPVESRAADALERTRVQTAMSQLSKVAPSIIEVRVRSGASSTARPAAAGSSSNPSAWRAVGTSIEVSTGSGGWQRLPIHSPAVLLAGDAPSPNVCWLVGRSGVVMRTATGRDFELLPPPAAAHLTAVRALDTHQATVTTEDGRLFTTTDAGQTWTQTR